MSLLIPALAHWTLLIDWSFVLGHFSFPRPRIQIPDLRRVHPRAPAQGRHPGEMLHDAPFVHADEDLPPRVGLHRARQQLGHLIVGALSAVDVDPDVLADGDDDLLGRGWPRL